MAELGVEPRAKIFNNDRHPYLFRSQSCILGFHYRAVHCLGFKVFTAAMSVGVFVS